MEIYQYSDQGGRSQNEDFCDVFCKNTECLIVLADGLGGHGGGRLASEIAVHAFGDLWKDNIGRPITKEMLFERTRDANQKILEKQTAQVKMMATIVALYLDTKDKKAMWIHLGDSRLYHFVNGKIVFCTFDHSVSRLAVLTGEIGFDEIRSHPDRNRLLKAVGTEELSLPEYGDAVLADGSREVFLLCSDGFWEYVTEAEMEQTLVEATDPEAWLAAMRGILQKRVRGNNDNNTAVAVFI